MTCRRSAGVLIAAKLAAMRLLSEGLRSLYLRFILVMPVLKETPLVFPPVTSRDAFSQSTWNRLLAI
jgi:hypothetical protein